MGYKKRAMSGFTWMGAFRILSRIISFIRIAILARLLSPSQFGVFGVASLAMTFLETITQTQIGTYLIQEKKDLKENIDTAYFLSIVRGILISLFLLISAKPISYFFNSSSSIVLMQLMSVISLVKGFINPARISYLKDLEFKKEFTLNMGIYLSDFAITLVFAFITKSPIALVLGLLAGALFEAVYSHLKIDPKPKFTFVNHQLKDMLKRGKWFTGLSITSYLFEQGDDMIVGKLLDTSALGIYQLAYKISILPITEIARVFSLVSFPIYTNISEDMNRLRKAFFKMIVFTAIMIIPIGLVLYFFSSEIVLVLLGNQWQEMVPVLKILAVFGVIRAIIISFNPLFNSIKKQNYTTIISSVSLLVMMFTIGPFIECYGVTGAGYSVVIASVLTIPLTIYFLKKIFN